MPPQDAGHRASGWHGRRLLLARRPRRCRLLHRGCALGEYLQRYNPYKGTRIPTAQFTAEGGFYYNFLSDARKIFFFYVGGSALAGYETVNWGDKTLFDGARLTNKDAFIYGGAVSLEMEAYLADRIALTVNVRERCLWGGSTGHFHTQYGIGVKFIID